MNENRHGRNVAGGLFIAGGILTGLLLALLQAFARSQAGMSDGAGSGPPSRESAIIPLLCSYFVVSAFGVLSTGNKRTLQRFALVAHLLVLLAYGIACSEAHAGKILSGMLTLAVIMGVYFLPGMITWSVVLAKATLPAENKVSPP